MQHKLLNLFCFFSLLGANAQIVFQENIIEENNGDTPIQIHAGDLDGDGDQDIVVASISNDKIFWLENIDGLGTFGTQNVITTTADGARTVFIADVDGDGDNDLLTGSQTDDIVAWYENLDGLGSFSTINVITTNSNSPKSVVAADLDGDNDLDVLVASFNDDTISWFENLDGLGDFGFEQIITVTANGGQSVTTADFDGDNDLDVVAASFNDYEVAWYRNDDGDGDFVLGQSVISTPNDFKTWVSVADIDNDGDIDIVSASWQGTREIAWYENTDGLGTFSVEHLITNATANATAVVVGDLDNDGDIDVVTSSQTNDIVAWHENIDGLGTFGEQQIITDNANSAQSVFIADIDGDGDNDVLAASTQDGKIAWHENSEVTNNQITGTIRLDTDANGCDTNDIVAGNLLIESTDGTSTFSTFSALNTGAYSLFPPQGEFTTSIQNLPAGFTVTPLEAESNFSGLGETDNQDFCIESNGAFNDLNVAIYPSINEPRPGFDTSYRIVYNNVGTNTLSGTIVFEYDNSKLNFLSASENINSQTANSMTFNYSNLNPFESRTIDLQFNVFPPPTTNIDDILMPTATINPLTGDASVVDNVFVLEQLVIGSYDPNDITVLQGSEVLIDDADKYLNYLIRFQNTGTASAINVRVEHVLDDKLDWATMQLESLSDPGRVEILDGNNVQFIFDNINLPDSTSDEAGSIGYITFKIKPKSNVIVGDIISGVADIYFDFNQPIITNTVTTEFVEPLSTDTFNNNDLKLYPNPIENVLYITTNQTLDEIIITDIKGRPLLSKTLALPSATIDVSDFSSGVYFITIRQDGSEITKKLIKK